MSGFGVEEWKERDMATVASLTERVRLIALSLATSAKKGDVRGVAKWAHQLADAAAKLAATADPTHPTIVVTPPAPIVPVNATSKFVADFGSTPGDIHDATVRKIQAAGQYVANADGSWPAKSEADWLDLFAKFGGDAAVAALLVTQFNPREIIGELGNVPPQAVPLIERYWCGVIGVDGTWYAYKDGALLGSFAGNWAGASVWCESVGISPNSNAWY